MGEAPRSSVVSKADAGDRLPIILQVVPRLNSSGGTERGTVDIARAVAAAGWGSLVVSAGGPLVGQLRNHDVRHIEMPVDSKNPLVIRANIERLASLVREAGVDIIHARSRAPAWSAHAAARRTGCHFVTTVQGIHGTDFALKRRYNAIMTQGELVITNSRFTAEHVIEMYQADPARIRIIHRGVDLDVFAPEAVSSARIIGLAERWRLPDGAPVVMLPGRLTSWKGHHLLIEAIERLGRRDICCVFVGEEKKRSNYRSALERDIERRGLGGVVRLVGGCRDMAAAYMMADVVVSASSRPEAFGRVVAEAQAMGRPVVAANHGGAREIVIDGETGWLFGHDDPAALAAALGEALSLPEDPRANLAHRAMARVREHFGLGKMCNATLSVYAEVLEGNGADQP